MKKIFKEVMFFVIPLVIIVVIIDAFSFTNLGNEILGRVTFSTGYARSGSADVRNYVQRVRKESNATRLIVGDSVARQLFDGLQEDNDTYCIAACNQALTLAGQYLLINTFLENHDNVTDVYLSIVPMSLSADLDAELGYNYFVAPFTKESLINQLDRSTIEYLEKKFGKIFLEEWMVDFIDNSPINSKIYLNYMQDKEQGEKKDDTDIIVSDVNILYLDRIYNLCKEKGVELHLFSGPVPDNLEQTQFVNELETLIQEKNYVLLEDYVRTIPFYDEKMFPDGTHLGGEYNSSEYYYSIINGIQEETGLLEDFAY